MVQATDGRNIKVEELNERRLRAVKLRLAGVSASDTAARTGLSELTVVRALKAYQQGGWAAVPVGPRGRGIKKGVEMLREDRDPIRALPGSGHAKLASLTHLQRLEAESIHILREVVAEAANPVMLYSIGKDSSVMLHLARKAFYPGKPPFPLMHVDTTWKFRDMYAFRERMVAESGMQLIAHVNQEGLAMGINPFVHGSAIHTDIMKTQALKQALEKYGFDAAFGGARRDEEKSRAKERICSFRSAQHRWDPKNQRPELWNLFNGRKNPGEHFRVFPLSNWTEMDVWQYIAREQVPLPSIYFTHRRRIVNRDGVLLADTPFIQRQPHEAVEEMQIRFRTVGDATCTGAVVSKAATVEDIIQEVAAARVTERGSRFDDQRSDAAMEDRKRQGYF